MSTLIPIVTKLTHEMRLFGIHGGIERRSQEALATGHHPLEYLRLILEDEKLARRDRTAKMLTSRAHFRSEATLEDWDHEHDRGLTKPVFRDMASLGFYQNRENLLVIGETGSGKTHLAIALGKKLCSENISVIFFSVNLLFEECQAERAAGRYLNLVKRIKQTAVLILDDFGLRNYSHEEANVLVDLLEERYQKGSVILTSQVDPKGWKKLFEDPVIADAITDRLTKPAKIVVFKGKDISYRDKLKFKKNQIAPQTKKE